MRYFALGAVALLVIPAVAAFGAAPPPGSPAADGAYGLALAPTLPLAVAAEARATLVLAEALERADGPVGVMETLAAMHLEEPRLARLAAVTAAGATGDAFATARAAIAPGGFALPIPVSTSAADALIALAALHGVPLSDAEAARLSSDLSVLDADADRALAALADGARAQRLALTLGPDAVAVAQANLALAAERAVDALRPAKVNTWNVCGAFSLDLAGNDDTWTCNVPFSVDIGGNDVYANNAAASVYAVGGLDEQFVWLETTVCAQFCFPLHWGYMPMGCRDDACPPVAFFFDLVGNDNYIGTLRYHSYPPWSSSFACIGAATAYGGASMLVDYAGDDSYAPWDPLCHSYSGEIASAIANAAASAVLIDVLGNDIYGAVDGRPGRGVAFANWGQLAVIVDGYGDDRYAVQAGGSGIAAARLGTAVLADLNGADRYESRARETMGFAEGAQASALLFDGGVGNDVYLADGGSDLFHRAMGVAVDMGVGALVDAGGDNLFRAVNAGSWLDNGVLAQGAASYPGGSLLGDVLFTEATGTRAWGILVAGDGDDTYEAQGDAQASATRASRGLLVDTGGDNTYVATHAGAPGLRYAQASARHGGTALLADFGDRANFTLGSGLVGQGAATFAVGLLYQANADRLTTYTADAGSFPSHVVGAASGIRVTRGESLLFGVIPDFTCQDSIEIYGTTTTLIGNRAMDFHACTPDQESKERLRNPVNGDPLEDAPKPVIPCRDGTVQDLLQCEERVSEVFGPGGVDFLEDSKLTMQASGGLAWISDVKSINGRYTVTEADNTCRFSCNALWRLAE